MKGKIKRAAKSLMRWSKKNHMEPEKAMKALINRFNRVFFENDNNELLTWSRWFFPVITRWTNMMHILPLKLTGKNSITGQKAIWKFFVEKKILKHIKVFLKG